MYNNGTKNSTAFPLPGTVLKLVVTLHLLVWGRRLKEIDLIPLCKPSKKETISKDHVLTS